MFIQVIQGRVSDVGAMHEATNRWVRDLAPNAYGWLGTTGGVAEDGTLIVLARFSSREEAQRNSERPEQGVWWQETEKLFSGDVTFHDCNQVEEYMGGGSDEAGFVQIIQGRVTDLGRLRTIMSEGEQDLARFRPDLMGGVAAITDDGLYTEAAYFTSEDEARKGERQEMPAELGATYKEFMELFEGGPSFYDLRDPWLESP